MASHWIAPHSSVCQGCAKANDMARVVMYDVLEGMHTQSPLMQLTQFVDDVQQASDAPGADAVVTETVRGAELFIDTCDMLDLKVSRKKISGGVPP